MKWAIRSLQATTGKTHFRNWPSVYCCLLPWKNTGKCLVIVMQVLKIAKAFLEQQKAQEPGGQEAAAQWLGFPSGPSSCTHLNVFLFWRRDVQGTWHVPPRVLLTLTPHEPESEFPGVAVTRHHDPSDLSNANVLFQGSRWSKVNVLAKLFFRGVLREGLMPVFPSQL